MNKPIFWVAVVVSLCFLALTGLYWTTPAGSLPHYVPGFVQGSTHTHFKHGLGTLILAVGLLAFAWFQIGPKKA
jgi:hypothetical protein